MISKLTVDLIAQYSQTDYQIGSGCSAFVIHVDHYSESMFQLMAAEQVSSAGIITAYNPYSQVQHNQQNRIAHSELLHALEHHTLPIIESVNIDASGQWPDEESLCVFGMSLESIRQLGHQFGQNAVVWIESDAVPRLVLLC